MAREARIFAEGSLRWVQSSGTGAAWGTASAPASALVGFVQAGTTYSSAQTVVTVAERGRPHHHKIAGWEPIEVQFTYLQAVTANIANPATASGVSTPQVHLELRAQDNEVAAASAQYYQMHNCVLMSRGWTEGEDGNQYQETWRALGMVGPTASGYLS
jgi:hypothetical protein